MKNAAVRRTKMDASYTVEMALLMPILLGLLYGVICLSFLGYDRVVLRSMAYGSIVTAECREAPVLLIHQKPEIEWAQDEKAVEIRYRTSAELVILRLAGLRKTDYESRGSAERRENDPVTFVRRCRMMERLWEGAKER